MFARTSNQPTKCAHIAKVKCIVCSTVMSASFVCCICHGFHLSVWASKMVAKPSVHQTCCCGWPGRPRAERGPPDETLEYVIAAEAFLLQEGQLECLICHMVGKGIEQRDFVIHLRLTPGLAQTIQVLDGD